MSWPCGVWYWFVLCGDVFSNGVIYFIVLVISLMFVSSKEACSTVEFSRMLQKMPSLDPSQVALLMLVWLIMYSDNSLFCVLVFVSVAECGIVCVLSRPLCTQGRFF